MGQGVSGLGQLHKAAFAGFHGLADLLFVLARFEEKR